jgi:hypothetical protein
MIDHAHVPLCQLFSRMYSVIVSYIFLLTVGSMRHPIVFLALETAIILPPAIRAYKLRRLIAIRTPEPCERRILVVIEIDHDIRVRFFPSISQSQVSEALIYLLHLELRDERNAVVSQIFPDPDALSLRDVMRARQQFHQSFELSDLNVG